MSAVSQRTTCTTSPYILKSLSNSAEEPNAAMVLVCERLWEQQCVSVGAVLQIRSVRSEGHCWQLRLFIVVQLSIPKMVYRRWTTTAVYILLWTWHYFTMGPLSRKKRNQNALPAMTGWNELQISSFETQRGKPTKWRRNQTPREKSQGQENGTFMLRRHGGVAVPLFSLSRTIVGRNYEQLSTKQNGTPQSSRSYSTKTKKQTRCIRSSLQYRYHRCHRFYSA